MSTRYLSPGKSKALRDFAVRRCPQGVRYVINTHAHADHTHGSYLFPGAELISHRKNSRVPTKFGEQSSVQARTQTPELAEVKVRLPDLVFDSVLTLRLGGKTITLRHSPGHSPDLITVRVKEDKVLFASDTILPVPYLDFPGGGSIEDLRRSLRSIEISGLENVVQGHGEVLLRGEIRSTIVSSLKYLDCIEQAVEKHVANHTPVESSAQDEHRAMREVTHSTQRHGPAPSPGQSLSSLPGQNGRNSHEALRRCTAAELVVRMVHSSLFTSVPNSPSGTPLP